MRVVKNELLNLNDFVFVKENAFTDEFCDSLIENFESLKTQGLTRQGQSGIGVNNDVKSTTDLDMFQFPDLMETYIQEASQIFNETLSESFLGKLPYQKEFGKDELFHNTTFYELMQIQGLKVSPKKGQLLIHPASFPFVHKGHTPTSDDKYILTTWLSYVPE